MTFLDTINAIDIPDFAESGELPLGSFTWMHGNKAGKTPGAFYGKAIEFSGTPAAPWVADNDRFDGENGYSAPTLKIAIIGYRSQWYTGGEAKGERKVWLPNYVEGIGAKKQVELIVFAEGLGDEPMIVTLPKVSKAKPMEQIIKLYRNGLLTQASRVAKRALPLWSFWLPIHGATKDGKAIYEEFSGKDGKASYVTTPVLDLPADALDTLFVGADLIARGAEVANQYAAWFNERRLPPQISEGVVEPEPLALPAPAGRNVPQEVTDADLF